MSLTLIGLSKQFGDFTAVKDVSIKLAEGQVLSLLGPSGCGKTTTLRMIAGFEEPSHGRILVHGADVTTVPARRRNMGMVFQSYALFPHLSVLENVAFGLDMRRVRRSERESRVRRALSVVHMDKFAERMPRQLSGGQQQRVALARALVIEPNLLLLDEPLSALDLKLREEMRDEIHRIVRELGITTVFVTHDQGEALVLSDLVGVMNAGKLEQLDSPRNIYRAPKTRFVAQFIGGANVLAGAVDRAGSQFQTTLGIPIPAPENLPTNCTAVAIRPEDIDICSVHHAPHARVLRARFLGDMVEYTLEMNGTMLNARNKSDRTVEEGAIVGLDLSRAKPVFLSE